MKGSRKGVTTQFAFSGSLHRDVIECANLMARAKKTGYRSNIKPQNRISFHYQTQRQDCNDGQGVTMNKGKWSALIGQPAEGGKFWTGNLRKTEMEEKQTNKMLGSPVHVL